MIKRKDAKSKISVGKNAHHTPSPWLSLVAIAVIGMAIAFSPTQADQSDSAIRQTSVITTNNGSPMQATIEQIDLENKSVAISVGSSTIIDMNVPLVRTSVTTPDIAEITVLSPRQVLVTGKSIGTTQIVLWDEKDNRLVFAVNVEPDLTRLRAAIKEIAPEADVEVHSLKGTIILSGLIPDTDVADRIMNVAKIISDKVNNQMVLAGEQQVLLRCTVAEVNKRAVRQLGINGWLAGDNIRDVFVVSQLGGINPTNIGLSPTTDIIAPGALTFGTPGVPLGTTPQLSLGFPRVQMQVFFRALQSNNLLRVLAEPNLIALNGQTATFLAGGEFPIPVSQGISGAVTVEFREFGVQLAFTPTILGREMIRLNVAPEVSELDFSAAVQIAGFTVPGLTQRRAETTIELASGSTIAIAGLLQETMAGINDRIPGLGDIPVLGQLFRSEEYQQDLTELVILVTPELVSAMHPDQVAALPGEDLTPPNDWQLYGLGMLQGEPAVSEKDPDQALESKMDPTYRKYSSSLDQMSLHGTWGVADASETMP